jgi:chromosome segregation ATPase
MDIDQFKKQVEWLDKERRSDKKIISTLQKRIAQLEGLLDKSNKFIKETNSEVTRLGVLVTKIDKYDDALSAHRAEVKKEMDAHEKRAKRREQNAKKRQGQEIDDLGKTVAEFKQKFEAFSKLRDELIMYKEEDDRRNRLLAELKDLVDGFGTAENERNKTFRSMEEDRRQDKKRLTDLQGEVSALRKRSDEHRGKLELVTEGQKRVDNRLNELLAAENERRETQNAFVEKVNQDRAERDKTYREWSKRFDTIDEQSKNFAESLLNIDEAERAVERAREDFQEINDQINRRINEITEMQRLGEERFRQEWSTFRADDQKRWTNYTLTQDEQHREMNRRIENLTDRTTNLEENLQDLQDSVQHLSEQTEKLMQALLGGLRDWLAENERFESSIR